MVDLEQSAAGVYNQGTAQVMMTLCGISYWDDGTGKRDHIKAGIVAELAKKGYSTAGCWSLAWGPVISSATDNLIYIARLQGSHTYAIVMRGTVEAYGSIVEDIPTGQVDFSKYSASGVKVSLEFGNALFALTFLPDPDLNTNLIQFLHGAIGNAPGATIFCTGHSQGGALAPMLMGRLGTMAKYWKAKVRTYSFAGPTSGSPLFAAWADSTNALVRVVNPLDVVPYGYAAIDQIVPNDVPSKIRDALDRDALEGLLDLIEDGLDDLGAWQQPLSQTLLPAKAATGSMSNQILIQHECNSYLSLLGAPQLDFLPKSPL
jgi:Lipase (class 3)